MNLLAAQYEVEFRAVTFEVPLWVTLALFIVGAGIMAALVLWFRRRQSRP